MLELLTDPNVWLSFLTLSVLEIVLGIDNIIFLSIVSARLPEHQQALARRIGLILALVMRIALLSAIAWIIGLTQPIISLGGFDLSWRDIVLIGGGVFLIYKGTVEVHEMMEGHAAEANVGTSTFAAVIAQIVVLDLVFSLDSIITAVGMTDQLPVMVAAVVVAIAVMMLAAEPVSHFVNTHPSVKMLALSFLLLVGVALVADGLHFHIPRGYLYFAIAFSILVETLNLFSARSRKKRAAAARPAKGDAGTPAP